MAWKAQSYSYRYWTRICQWEAPWNGPKNKVLGYIQPEKTQQNAYIERDNRTVRNEWLNQYIFETSEKAQDQATVWLWTQQ